MKGQGVENLETYFKMLNTTKEKFEEEQARPTAQKRLERGFIIDEIAKAEKIQIDEKSLEEEFRNTWATLAMTDEEFSKRTKGGTKPTREIIDVVTMDSANRLMVRGTLEALKAIATGQASSAETVEEEKPAEAPKAKKKSAKKKAEEPVAEAEEPKAE